MRLLVIGGVAAGLSAAARARRLDRSLEIVVLEKGPVISYSACGLPFYIQGRVLDTRELIHYSPAEFQKQRNITVRTAAKVVSIAHPRREVILATGERVHYDRLVVAAGARPDTRGLEGISQPHVFTLHTLTDAERLQQFLTSRRPKRGVVIGAGYIGLEAADALRSRGIRVVVFERGPHVLGRDDGDLSDFVRGHLARFGVELRTNAPVKTIGADRVEDVPADVVIVAPGLLPNVELALDAGLQIGPTGAVRTDERMGTNLAGVFAAGDCAETTHLVTGRPAYIPLGTTANKMGRVAGANAAGVRERFPGVTGTSIVRVFGLGIGVTGLSVLQARREGFSPVAARIEGYTRARYFWGTRTSVELIADRQSKRLLGGTVIGEEDAGGRINVVATALHSRMRVDDFEQLDLSYSPPFSPVWDPLLICAQQLIKSL